MSAPRAADPLAHGRDGTGDDVPVDRAEERVNSPGDLPTPRREGTVQVGEDLPRVLPRAEIDQDQVKISPDRDLGHLEPIAVKGHQDRTVSERAPLVHAPAARRSGDLAAVGKFHLFARGQLETVDAVESPRGQNAHRRAGGEALLDWQIGPVVVIHEPADLVMEQDLVGDTGHVAPEPAAPRPSASRVFGSIGIPTGPSRFPRG